jgi:hypothetical protein
VRATTKTASVRDPTYDALVGLRVFATGGLASTAYVSCRVASLSQPPALAIELPDAYAPGTDLEFRFSVASLRFQEVHLALLKSKSSPFG